jgi:hypothetical protein
MTPSGRRLWQIGPFMDLKFHDDHEKQFMVKSLRLSDEAYWRITWFGFSFGWANLVACLCFVQWRYLPCKMSYLAHVIVLNSF